MIRNLIFASLIITAYHFASLSAQCQSGNIPVNFSLDKPGYVTLVIEDKYGKRVANLISETKLDAGQHCVYWEGYDDGLPSSPKEESPYIRKRVKPGTYNLRGLIHDGIKLRYEFSVYSPGNPPWKTEDSTGAWTADHCVVNDCLFLPAVSGSPYGNGADQMMLSSTTAESGHGIIWTDLDANKNYGLSWGWDGARAIDRDIGTNAEKHFYAYALFPGCLRGLMNDGKAEEILKWTPKKTWPIIENWLFLDLAVRNGVAVISNSDNLDNLDESIGNLLIVDVYQKKILANHQIQTTRGITFDRNDRLLVIVGNQLKSYKIDKQTGSISDEQTIISTELEEPRKVLVHGDNILISDGGKSHQIKVFDVNGQLIRTIGKPGGPQIGKYDKTRMDHPEGFDIDSHGKLWVAEFSYVPRRVSMWNFEDGSFIRAIYGRPQYGGGGFLDPEDKTRFYYSENVAPEKGGLLFKLDWQTGTAELTHIYYRSLRPTRGQAQSWDALYQGPKEPQPLFMNCEPILQYANIYAPKYVYNVKGHRYITNTGNLRFGDDGVLFIWNLDGDIAKPVSAIGMRWMGMTRNIIEGTKDSANIKT
ncbi:hypothetical protein FJZ33_10250, partial [Candidatus Poribacteria bacterium]|nr:hypothetical protein [Candidatus Poribacteria bacterium]